MLGLRCCEAARVRVHDRLQYRRDVLASSISESGLEPLTPCFTRGEWMRAPTARSRRIAQSSNVFADFAVGCGNGSGPLTLPYGFRAREVSAPVPFSYSSPTNARGWALPARGGLGSFSTSPSASAFATRCARDRAPVFNIALRT